MKSVAIEINETPAETAVVPQLGLKERIGALVELTKPRITFLLLLTAAAGFCLGSQGPINLVKLAHTMVGLGLLASGVATLNQYWERGLDSMMARTESRPLPTRRVSPAEALAFGLILTFGSEVYLALLVNPLTSLLGVVVIVGYVLMYTPLKTKTSLATVVGAFPGAMPPFIGWAAANNQLHLGAWVLFAIIFLWQFPHFLAIATLYRDDYKKAGILMLPVIESNGRMTGRQIVLYTLMLIPTSLVPTLIGMTGKVYFYGAVILGLVFLYVAVRAALDHSKTTARRLLLASVIYLPLLFILMVLNQRSPF
jgi:protoheme IX farnesyltransferase